MKLKLEYEYDHIGADKMLNIIKHFENELVEASTVEYVKLIELKITSE